MGSSRSGTTMLDLILSSSPNTASVGELILWKKRSCGFCGKNCDYWKEFKKQFDGNYYKTAFDVFKTDTIVDSSKKWKWFSKRFRKENYDYKLIHIVRNGKDRLKFRIEAGEKCEKRIIQSWVNTFRECEKVRKKYGGILVKYEEIPKLLWMITNYIDVEYVRAAFWEKEHHGLLGSKTAYSLVKKYHDVKCNWKTNFPEQHGFNTKPRIGHEFLSKKDIGVFNKYGRELNRELGYE